MFESIELMLNTEFTSTTQLTILLAPRRRGWQRKLTHSVYVGGWYTDRDIIELISDN